MEYIYEIGWLMLWPIVIFITFKLSSYNIKKFEEKNK